MHLRLGLLMSLAHTQQHRAHAQDAAADRTIMLRVDRVVKLARGDVAPWDDRWTTFALTAVLPPSAANLYEIFGTDEHPLSFPPAWQAFAPWAQDIGGALTAASTWTNPPTVGGLVLPRDQMCSTCGCACGYDSWLTVGIIEGDATHELRATGIDFTPNFVDRGWFLNEQTLAGHGIDAPAGSVAWGDPARAPGNDDAQHGGVQIAQMTVPTGSQWSVLVNLRGLTAEGTTWEVYGVEFTQDGSPVVPIPGPAPEPEPEPPPPPPPRPTSGPYDCEGFWSDWVGCGADGEFHGGACEANPHCCLPQWEQTFTVTRRATAGGRACAAADGARKHAPCVGDGATQEADVCSPWPACAAALPVPSGCTAERVAAAVALSSTSSTSTTTTPAAGSGH